MMISLLKKHYRQQSHKVVAEQILPARSLGSCWEGLPVADNRIDSSAVRYFDTSISRVPVTFLSSISRIFLRFASLASILDPMTPITCHVA